MAIARSAALSASSIALLFASAAAAFKAEASQLLSISGSPSMVAKVHAQAKALCDEYIEQSAERQVNIPSDMRLAAMAALTDGSLGACTFDAAREECYKLMARDTLPRFMQSAGFGEALEYFGSYEVEKAVGASSKDIELDLELMAA